MLRLLAHRLLLSIPLLFIVTGLTFVLVALVPGSAATTILGTASTPEKVAALNERADSTGGRNEFRELLRWCQIAECLAWSTVERVLDRGQLSAGDDAQIGALRQVLA